MYRQQLAGPNLEGGRGGQSPPKHVSCPPNQNMGNRDALAIGKKRPVKSRPKKADLTLT